MKNQLPVLMFLAVLLSGLPSCGGGPGALDAAPPLSIGPWQQERYFEAAEAKAMIDRMHPTSIAAVNWWVGYYGGGNGITIYASKFTDPAQAQSALEAMRDAIGQSKTGFAPPQAATIAKQPGYRTTGMNKEHFFYAHNTWLIWIEGKTGDFEPTVKSMRWVKPSRKS